MKGSASTTIVDESSGVLEFDSEFRRDEAHFIREASRQSAIGIEFYHFSILKTSKSH